MSDKIQIGDYISVDHGYIKPTDFKGQEINWYSSSVIGIEKDGGYRVSYDTGLDVYYFPKLKFSHTSNYGNKIYYAFP